MKLLICSSLLLASVLTACGSSKDEQLSYDLTYNGCGTGKQTFDAKDKMCAGLKDDARNNGYSCARALRVDYYHQNCGTDWNG